jgi:hypothetical protein
MKRIFIILMLCAMLMVVGCSGEEVAPVEPIAMTKKVEVAEPRQVQDPGSEDEDAADAPSAAAGKKEVSPAKESGEPDSSAASTATPKPSASSNAENAVAASSSGSGSNSGINTEPAATPPSAQAPAPAPVESTPTPMPETTPEPTPAPTPEPIPATTPQPTEPPKQGGYAYCSCGAALSESDYAAHMKQHQMNGEDHCYSTY